MHSRPRFTEHFDLNLNNSTQGDIIPIPQAVSRMEPASREAVYIASYRPMTIIAGDTIIQGEPVSPPADFIRHGKGKGRDGDQLQAGSAYPNPDFDEPLSPLEQRNSLLETVNNPYTSATWDNHRKRQTLLDELSRFSFDSARSLDWDTEDLDVTAELNNDNPADEDEDDDLDITIAELQGDQDNGEGRYRINSYEEVLIRCRDLADEAAAAAAAANATSIAGPARAHMPRARETRDASPLKPVPSLKYENIELRDMESGTTLTPSNPKSRGCCQAFVHAMDSMSRAYEEEYFPKTHGLDLSRTWRSACYTMTQLLDMVNEACVAAMVPKRYQPGVHQMV